MRRMNTDIERLHDVVTYKVSGRGCGKTYAACHELAGVLEVGKSNKIICIIKYSRDLKWLLPMISDVLKEYRLSIEKFNISQNMAKVSNGKIIYFKSRQRPSYIFEGYRETDAVDFIDY